MSSIKHFIERKDTHQWYCVDMHQLANPYISIYSGGHMGNIPRIDANWTNDPNKALSFESCKEAIKFMGDDVFDGFKISSLEVTEHEFIDMANCNCRKEIECCSNC